MEDKLLIIYLSIGDENGPSFSCLLANYYDYKDIIPKSNILVVNNGYTNDAEYVNCNFRDLFRKFNIVNVLEIHDWYDYLTDEQVIQKQKYVDNTYNNFIPKFDESLILITIVPYNQDPVKYLIPYNSEILRYINIFEEEERYEEKQTLANTMRPYIINTNYYQIMRNSIPNHIEVKSDEIDNPIHFQ